MTESFPIHFLSTGPHERPCWSAVIAYMEHHGLWLLWNCEVITSFGPTQFN